MWILSIGMWVLIVNLFGGCDSNTVTDPDLIVPVLEQVIRDCDRGDGVACHDVYQLRQCLMGERAECPVKGYGAF